MREIKLGTVSSHNFKGKFLVAIEEKWKNFFKDDPIFEAVIDKDGRYTLRGPIIQHSQHNLAIIQEDP